MHSVTLLAALAAVVRAQEIDWAVITKLTPLPTQTIPVVYATSGSAVATAVTLTYSESAILSSVASALSASAVVPLASNTFARRDGFTTSIISTTPAPITTTSSSSTTKSTVYCRTQPIGSGPVPSPDTPSAFLAYAPFSSIASTAPTPSGYVAAYTNLQRSSNAYGYIGFTTLTSYNTTLCAAKCSKINGCQSFNIYFERDPTLLPDSDTCSNPPSTTQIKCVFWGGPVSVDNALNKGQMRRGFRVVIAGSNGYVNAALAAPPGYAQVDALNTAVINAPFDCNGQDTYLQYVMFTSGGPFDANLCATACSSQNTFAAQQGYAANKFCRYFNTYILYKNGAALGQNCAMYSETWNSTYAVNTGYYFGADVYTVGSSYTYSNVTDAGVCTVAASGSGSSAPTSMQTVASSAPTSS